MKIVVSDAAYERISSSADGWTWERPRVTLIITGKNTSSAAIIIFDSGLSTPNQLLKIGAMAMIGIAFAAIAIGSTESRAVPQRATANPTTRPGHGPDDEAADRFLERGEHRGRQRPLAAAPVLRQRRSDGGRRGQDERSNVHRAGQRLPQHQSDDQNDQRRNVVAQPGTDPARQPGRQAGVRGRGRHLWTTISRRRPRRPGARPMRWFPRRGLAAPRAPR